MTTNELTVQMDCPSCHQNVTLPIQFRYGFVRCLRYKMGEKIKWNSESDVGDPAFRNVVVNAWSGVCPHCLTDQLTEFYIFIRNGIIESLAEADGRYFFVDDGDYRLLDDVNG